MSVQAAEMLTPYSTAAPLLGTAPTWMTPYDAQRILSYQLYEQIYWNVPETFKLQQRGSDSDPIYIPTARTIIDTTNRYVGKDFAFAIETDVGSESDQLILRNALTLLFRRERFWSKFASNKRFGLIRGDWLFHVLANPKKPAGSRIKIETLDPGAYFPVFHPDDPDRIIAVHIAEQVVFKDVTYIKRQTYQRGADPLENDGSDTSIWNSVALFDPKAWEDITLNPKVVISELSELPPQIAAIPVYHIKNIETPGDPFGSSEIRGFERVLGAINQAISDEELALALDGLGMYATDGGPPQDAQGNITDWILGPGGVVEHKPGSKFARVTGVTNAGIQAVMSHLGYLGDSVKEASGTPDVAIGKIDVTVAESGVALALQMGPMLAKVGERDQEITDTTRQMLFDLNGWLSAYEGINTPAIAVPVYGDVLPQNIKEQVAEILLMVTGGLVDSEWARQEIAKLRGYVFPSDIGTAVQNEMQQRATALDPFAERMAGEVAAEVPGSNSND